MRVRSLLLAAVICGAQACDGAPPAVATLLQEAESLRGTDPDRFAELMEQLNRRAGDATPNEREQLRYLNAYRVAYGGDYDSAIRDALQLFADAKDETLKFRAGAFVVNAYAATRQFAEGLRQLDRTLTLLPAIADPETRHHGIGAAALIYNQVGQFELGRHYAEMILAEPDVQRYQCSAGHLRLEALFHLRALPAEDAPFLAAIRQCESQHEAIGANFVRANLARKWFAEDAPAKALQELDAHLQEVEATRYPRLISEIHALIGQLHLALGRPDAAEAHARLALAQPQGASQTLPVVQAYRTLHDAAVMRRNPMDALEYYRQYADADKAYLNEVQARELAYQLAKHETLQKSQTIEILNKQNEVLRLEQQVAAKQAQNNRLLVALLGLLLFFIAYWAYKVKRVQLSFRKLAETDALTGVSNRHHFTRRAEEALHYCEHNKQDVSAIMFDLDHFKAINDTYGHPVGDWVLRRAAQVCRAHCRQNDLMGRLGGEEFALLLIGCGIETAKETAAKCRAAIHDIDTSESGHAFSVTASFGVTASSLSGFEFKNVIMHTDQALYSAKREGRDRVCVYVPPGTERGKRTAGSELPAEL